MTVTLGPRATRLLTAWGNLAGTHPVGPRYDLTTPTRSQQCRERLDSFIADPTDACFETLWSEDAIAAASEWHARTILNLWSGTLAELATFFAEIRSADSYDRDWEDRVTWGSVVSELYTRTKPDHPIISDQSRRGIQKLGIEPVTGFEAGTEQLVAFRESYLDIAGHVTAEKPDPIPVDEEIDQLFVLLTTTSTDDIMAEVAGPRGQLYEALRGYPAGSTGDRGPIEIDFQAATPAIDGHVAARKSNAYADTETRHWAGTHYETWKWDFVTYISTEVTDQYTLEDLSEDDLKPFFDAFWANADQYTDTNVLSTPVPQYLLGRWGVVQLQDFQENCFAAPAEAAEVLSTLFSEDEHLVSRLDRFHDFAESDEVSDGNLLRIATTLLMGANPDRYVNFQYERFDTFFSDCSDSGSLSTGYDAQQYYRIVLACRDLRDAMQNELPDASLLDVHTLIRLYQDYKE